MSSHAKVTFFYLSAYFNLHNFEIDQTGKHAVW